MRGPLQSAMRKLTHVTRTLALRSAGKAGSNTALIRHVGRRPGKTYETPSWRSTTRTASSSRFPTASAQIG